MSIDWIDVFELADQERRPRLRLATKLESAKSGMRYGYKAPRVHPRLRPEERDLIVKALRQ